MGKWGYSSINLDLETRWSRVVSFIPRQLYYWLYYWTGGWVDPRIGLDAVEKSKSCLCRKSNPGSSACSPSLYRLSSQDSGQCKLVSWEHETRDSRVLQNIPLHLPLQLRHSTLMAERRTTTVLQEAVNKQTQAAVTHPVLHKTTYVRTYNTRSLLENCVHHRPCAHRPDNVAISDNAPGAIFCRSADFHYLFLCML
jgi:hypothetical protein